MTSSPTNRMRLSLPPQQMGSDESFDNTFADEEDDPHINRLWEIHRRIHSLRGSVFNFYLVEALETVGSTDIHFLQLHCLSRNVFT